MAVQVKIEFLHEGFRELLSSQELAKECAKAANEVASRAGRDWQAVGPWHANFGGGRAAYTVRATSKEALIDEANDKVLTRAVHG